MGLGRVGSHVDRCLLEEPARTLLQGLIKPPPKSSQQLFFQLPALGRNGLCRGTGPTKTPLLLRGPHSAC